MKTSLALVATFLAAAAIAAPAPSLAATDPATTKPQVKPSASKAPVKRNASKAVAPVAALVLEPAGEEQKAAAALTHLGDYACEFDQTVKVGVNALAPGYIDVTHKVQTWVMKPVLSSTGALRLEDVRGRMLMIQIANKSMVMDAQIGQRVVDGCQHENQREFERSLQGKPAEGTLLRQ